jgi:hypothetical protein
MIRVQDTEISSADNSTVLEWARKKSILLTHGLDTMTKYGNERIEQGLLLAVLGAIRLANSNVEEISFHLV